MDYTFIRCSCGGTIGMYNRETFTCEQCRQEFKQYFLNYDGLKINDNGLPPMHRAISRHLLVYISECFLDYGICLF